MLHLFAWSGLGVLIGTLAWLRRSAPALGLAASLLPALGGAVFGGLLAWTFWDFPTEPTAFETLASAPSALSFFLAALGSLAAVTFSIGTITRTRGER